MIENSLLTAEPVGPGSRFALDAGRFGCMTMEVVAFDPPSTWTAHSVDATLPIRLRGTVAAGGLHAARLTMRIEIRPRGVLGPLAPIVAMLMRRTALENVVRIKEAVERRYVK